MSSKIECKAMMEEALRKSFGDDEVHLKCSTANRFGYLIDMAIPDYKLIVECCEDSARSRMKERYFAERGWVTVRFTKENILGDLKKCVDIVRKRAKSIKKGD